MSGENADYQAWKQQRLQNQLEIQSHQIERIFTQHHVDAQVSGGTVHSSAISFSLQTQLVRGWEYLLELKRDLMASLGVRDVHLGWQNGQLQLNVTRPEEPPVALLDLLPLLPDLPPITGILGLDEEGHPLLLDFVSPDIAHVLITGMSGAGKTSLLRTLALSLALTNRQAQLQMVVLAPETAVTIPDTPPPNSSYDILEPLTYLPHLVSPVLYNLDDVKEMLRFLAQEMKYRQEQAIETPALIVFIDRVDVLMVSQDEAAHDDLTRLLQHGAEVAMYLVLSATDVTTAVGNNSWRANLPIRLVGRVPDEQTAQTSAGIPATQAEYLLGQGDFLAIVQDSTTYFQAAYIGNYDLHLTIQKLHRAHRKTLLAQPFNMRPSLSTAEIEEIKAADDPQTFSFDGKTAKTKQQTDAPSNTSHKLDNMPPPFNGSRDWYAADDVIPFH